MKTNSKLFGALCAVGLLSAASAAQAASVTFTASSGNKSASAVFSVSAGVLKVVLTNTSTADTLAPSDLLTGVFWSMNGTPVLAVNKVLITSGSTADVGTSTVTYTGGDVSSEFAFKATAGSPGAYTGANFSKWTGAQYGVSSSGLSSTGSGDGVFGVNDRFNTTTNLEGPASPDGANFGLASQGDILATGNGGISTIPIIKNSITITLKLPTSQYFYNPNGNIGNVWFQYGTSSTELAISSSGLVAGGPSPVPVPAALWMGLSTLAGMGVIGGIRRRRNRA